MVVGIHGHSLRGRSCTKRIAVKKNKSSKEDTRKKAICSQGEEIRNLGCCKLSKISTGFSFTTTSNYQEQTCWIITNDRKIIRQMFLEQSFIQEEMSQFNSQSNLLRHSKMIKNAIKCCGRFFPHKPNKIMQIKTGVKCFLYSLL